MVCQCCRRSRLGRDMIWEVPKIGVPLNIKYRKIIHRQKMPIILRTTHVVVSLYNKGTQQSRTGSRFRKLYPKIALRIAMIYFLPLNRKLLLHCLSRCKLPSGFGSRLESPPPNITPPTPLWDDMFYRGYCILGGWGFHILGEGSIEKTLRW